MIEQTLAAGSAAESFGYLIGSLFIPGAGLLLLIIGLRQRSASRRQPPGQIGYPQHPGYPPTPGYPPGYPQNPPGVYQAGPYPQAYPPVARKSRGTALIVIGALILVFGLFGLVAKTALHSSKSAAGGGLSIGDCITGDQYSSANMNPEPVSCSNPDAVYQLALKGDGSAICPDGERDESRYGVLTNSSRTYCFILDADEGECFDVEVAKGLFTPLECSDPAAVTKIAKRVDGSTDTSVCGPDGQAVTFPQPQRVYCVEEPS
ncbi:LppU/SCO3897 family protein [Mycolicibacterium frederiksbergense]|nr:hypothetical protein [Mycolicibacterium frederiksbergense]